jgi:hypothetical protein
MLMGTGLAASSPLLGHRGCTDSAPAQLSAGLHVWAEDPTGYLNLVAGRRLSGRTVVQPTKQWVEKVSQRKISPKKQGIKKTVNQ